MSDSLKAKVAQKSQRGKVTNVIVKLGAVELPGASLRLSPCSVGVQGSVESLYHIITLPLPGQFSSCFQN